MVAVKSENMKFYFSIFFIISIFETSGAGDWYEEASYGGSSGNAGVSTRITQNGLNYLNSILLFEMNEIIPRMKIDDLQYSEGRGNMRVTNGHVTKYKQPNRQSLTLQQPDQLIWRTSGADIAMSGHVQGSWGRFSDSGDVDVVANDVSFTIAIQPIKQSNGQFGTKTRNCQASIGWMDYHIYNSGAFGRMLDNMKHSVIKRMQPRVEQSICERVRKIFDNDINYQLNNYPTKIPMDEESQKAMMNGLGGQEDSNEDSMRDLPVSSSNSDQTIQMSKKLTKNITKQLKFDYSNLRDPNVKPNYVETYNKGEISYLGRGGTPFYPSNFREPGSAPSDRMFYAVVSDYVANSMLYNAYKHGLLKTRISARDNPEFKNYLKSNCEDSLFDLCLGSIIPEMHESFPNSQAEIEIEATEKSPAVIFKSDATVDIMGKVLVKLFGVKGTERRTMAVGLIDLLANAKVYIDKDQKVKGTSSIKKYQLTMQQNNLKGFNEKRLKEFTDSSKTMLQGTVNTYLKNGLNLPRVNIMKLRNSKVNIFDRTMRIETDVDVDKAALTRTIARQVAKHGTRVDGV